MSITHTPLYRAAFVQYLRKGTLPEIYLRVKADATSHPTTHYIWRTRSDDKVRGSHAENNGKIFAWDNPPPTGHPGEAYGCHCWAEPYYEPDATGIDDPPIEPVYPELLVVPALVTGRLAAAWRTAARAVQRSRNPIANKPKNFTDHGAIRSGQRKITQSDADAAIQSARETGDISTKIGKYGTPQIHYKGKNGVTVVVETKGRNAGKIITFWRHN